jgi:hypothetical protein
VHNHHKNFLVPVILLDHQKHQVVVEDLEFEVLDRQEAVKMRKQFQVKWWKYLKDEALDRMNAKKKYGEKGE